MPLLWQQVVTKWVHWCIPCAFPFCPYWLALHLFCLSTTEWKPLKDVITTSWSFPGSRFMSQVDVFSYEYINLWYSTIATDNKLRHSSSTVSCNHLFLSAYSIFYGLFKGKSILNPSLGPHVQYLLNSQYQIIIVERVMRPHKEASCFPLPLLTIPQFIPISLSKDEVQIQAAVA